MKRILPWLLVSLSLGLSQSALAYHEIFDRSPERIAEYFGTPIEIFEPSAEELGDIQWLEYDRNALLKVLPRLPRQSQFRIQFVKGKAQAIALTPASHTSEFTMNAKDFQAFFRYVFGFGASRFDYQPVPFNGMGHEGFQEFMVCMGAAVAIHYIEYHRGILNLTLTYNKLCE